ncbi:hypothetical protein [Fructobacillus cardui]|uniref:hypothetical protein n=1 Tax=Fructobacillus cardui TaxID=2893170 RepID=UPI00200AEBE7|nr:hypothetical protein [Fructobacillus cardui]MCK8628013.1 hypothetical protein [Fructobacillus cardui]
MNTSKLDAVSVLREELRAKNHTINQLNEQLINSQKLQLMSQPISEQLTNELHELKKLNHQNKVFGQGYLENKNRPEYNSAYFFVWICYDWIISES